MILIKNDGSAFWVKVGPYRLRIPFYEKTDGGFYRIYYASGPEGEEELLFKPLKGDVIFKASFRKKKGTFQREVRLSSLRREDLENLERYIAERNWHNVIDLVLFDTLIDSATLEVEWE